jgi:hypothetical protein
VVLQLMPLLLQVQQEQLALQLQQQQQGGEGQPVVKLEPGLTLQQQQQEGLPQLPAGLAPQDTPAMRALNSLMLDYSRELHTFAVLNRVSTQQLYTLNIETGVLGVPPPAGHWKKVAAMLKDRCGGWGLGYSMKRAIRGCTRGGEGIERAFPALVCTRMWQPCSRTGGGISRQREAAVACWGSSMADLVRAFNCVGECNEWACTVVCVYACGSHAGGWVRGGQQGDRRVHGCRGFQWFV